MRIKLLVDNPRLREMLGFLLALAALGVLLSLVSFSPTDPSSNLATSATRASNWMGLPGSYVADLLLQALGLMGFTLPAWLLSLGWKGIRSAPTERMGRTACGGILLTAVLCALLEFLQTPLRAALPDAWAATVRPGGAFGKVLVDSSIAVLNIGGTLLLMLSLTAVGLYLLTSLRLSALFLGQEEPKPGEAAPVPEESGDTGATGTGQGKGPGLDGSSVSIPLPDLVRPVREPPAPKAEPAEAEPPEESEEAEVAPPIVPYEGAVNESATFSSASTLDGIEAGPPSAAETPPRKRPAASRPRYEVPGTRLLNPPFERASYDEAQLQETGRQIVEKLDEFGVRGSINQISPGPVVTTFEYKPDRGVRYSKIVNLSEDLCLALECESILVERIPGKPTVGVEVPNRNREVIALKEVIDSPSFRQSKSILTFALGKDINGKIHCTDLASMPHLLVAGQTGSGKSVLVNCVIMSILLRATPDEVRFILVDPKTVELGLYRDIPHLLTPVITDMKKATNALKNATKEMERRLQLLAEYGVRNISQFNDKVAGRKNKTGDGDSSAELEKLPYIVVIVDELADLMMLAGRQVEESIQRLAQMARAVGIHLLLATQRPSVDVITGLIKANIPARLSFLLATRVDSRTILDSMGAESLLGKGDMLFLPPGTARMRRLHGPLVSEDEIEKIVRHWKQLAEPEYENEYLESPEGEQDEAAADDEASFDDPMYRDAVRIVLELGKASTSTLQRRLRLGYGRAARILDAMERDGIVGPPDGSRPREVLKRPDWLDEVENE